MSYKKTTKFSLIKQLKIDFYGNLFKKKQKITLNYSKLLENKENIRNILKKLRLENPLVYLNTKKKFFSNFKLNNLFFKIYKQQLIARKKEKIFFLTFSNYKNETKNILFNSLNLNNFYSNDFYVQDLIFLNFLNKNQLFQPRISYKNKYKINKFQFIDFAKKEISFFPYNKKKINTLFSSNSGIFNLKLKKEKILFFKSFCWIYGNLKKNRVKTLLANFAKSKTNKVLNLILLLEGRLDVFLFKCGFFESINASRTFIKLGNVLVNNSPEFAIDYQVKELELISIKKEKRLYVYKNFLKNLNLGFFFAIEPKYVEINYNTMSCILIKKYFTVKNIFFPLKQKFNLFALKNTFKFF